MVLGCTRRVCEREVTGRVPAQAPVLESSLLVSCVSEASTHPQYKQLQRPHPHLRDSTRERLLTPRSPQPHWGLPATLRPLRISPTLECQSLTSQRGSLGDFLNSSLFNGAFLVLLLDSPLRAGKRLLQEAQSILEDLP